MIPSTTATLQQYQTTSFFILFLIERPLAAGITFCAFICQVLPSIIKYCEFQYNSIEYGSTGDIRHKIFVPLLAMLLLNKLTIRPIKVTSRRTGKGLKEMEEGRQWETLREKEITRQFEGEGKS